jgi:hypothetical protein
VLKDLFGARGFDSISAASAWARQPSSTEEVVNMIWWQLEDRNDLLRLVTEELSAIGFPPDADEWPWYAAPRTQVKRLIEAHKDLIDQDKRRQEAFDAVLSENEELQRSLRNKDHERGEALYGYVWKIKTLKNRVGALLILLGIVIALNIASLFR